jgi:hypothetical protein
MRGKTPLSGLIARFEGGSKYTHVGCLINNSQVISAHWQDGVRLRLIKNEGDYKYMMQIKISCSDEIAKQHKDWLYSQLSRDYDKTALIAMAYRMLTGTPGRSGWSGQWFCSDLQAEGIIKFGFYPSIKVGILRSITPDILAWICGGIKGSEINIIK